MEGNISLILKGSIIRSLFMKPGINPHHILCENKLVVIVHFVTSDEELYEYKKVTFTAENAPICEYEKIELFDPSNFSL